MRKIVSRRKRPSVKIGQIFKTPSGECEVKEYYSWDNIVVEFKCGYRTKTQISPLTRGQVKNPFFPSVSGVGFTGEGRHKPSVDRVDTKPYVVWSSMIRRCYSLKQQERQPSYKGCIVDEQWHNFQNFAEWYEDNIIAGWNLDKDLIVKGNKVYGPETCCFIPTEVNSFLTKREVKRGDYLIGVTKTGNRFRSKAYTDGATICESFLSEIEAFMWYKRHKEDRAKYLAEKHKTLLTELAYKRLIEYTVDITD